MKIKKVRGEVLKKISLLLVGVIFIPCFSFTNARAAADDAEETLIYEQNFESQNVIPTNFANSGTPQFSRLENIDGEGYYGSFRADTMWRNGFSFDDQNISTGKMYVEFDFHPVFSNGTAKEGAVVIGDSVINNSVKPTKQTYSLIWIKNGIMSTGGRTGTSTAYGGTDLGIKVEDKWYTLRAYLDLDTPSINISIADKQRRVYEGGLISEYARRVSGGNEWEKWPLKGTFFRNISAIYNIDLDNISVSTVQSMPQTIELFELDSIRYRNSGGNITNSANINTSEIDVVFTQAVTEAKSGAVKLNGEAVSGSLSEDGMFYTIPVSGLVANREYVVSLDTDKLTPLSGFANTMVGNTTKTFVPDNVYINFNEDFKTGTQAYDFSGGANSAVADNLYMPREENENTFGKFHSSSLSSSDDYRRVGINLGDGIADGAINLHFKFRKTKGKAGFVILGDETKSSGEYNWLGLLYMNADGNLYSGCGYGGNLLKNECLLKKASGEIAAIEDGVWYNYAAEIDIETKSLKVAVTDSSGAEVGNIWLRNLNSHSNDNKDYRYVNWPYETNFKKLAAMFTVDIDDVRINTVDDLMLSPQQGEEGVFAEVSLTVRDGKAGNKSLIVAQYDCDGVLISTSVISENLNENETVRLADKVAIDEDAVRVKAMYWDIIKCKALSDYAQIEQENGRWPIAVDEWGLDNPLSVSVTSDYAGNIFDADDEKLLNINIENNTSYNLSAEIEYNWFNHNGSLIDIGDKLEVDMPSRGKSTYLVKVPQSITEYDTYYLKITRAASGMVAGNAYEMEYSPAKYDFSIMNKLTEDDEPNNVIRTNSHHGVGWGDPEVVLKMATEVGFSGIRDEIRWHHAELEEGVYTKPTGKRDWINSAERNGLSSLWILDYSNLLYTDNLYAFPDDSKFKGSEDAFVKYVDWVSKTYGNEIEYYQLWNEPDTSGFNYYSSGASKYVKLLKKVYPVIKKNDPDAKVVGVAASRNGLGFAKLVLLYGGGDYMDAISFHPYQATGKFSGESHIKAINNYKNALKSYGHADMPMLITEMGIAAFPEGGVWPDEYVAAAQTIQMWAISQADSSVEAVYQFHFMNNHPSILWDDAQSIQQRFGLINHENELVPYSARPAAIAAAAYNKLVGNAKVVNQYTKVADENGHKTYLYHFEREKDGKDVLIYWTEYGSERLKINLGTENVTGYDMNSNPIQPSISDSGIVTLTSSYEPSYIVGDFSDFEIIN